MYLNKCVCVVHLTRESYKRLNEETLICRVILTVLVSPGGGDMWGCLKCCLIVKNKV